MRTLLLATFVAALLVPLAARADAPLRPPERFEAFSPDRTVVAVSDPAPEPGVTTVYRVGPDGRRDILWVLPGWHRALYVANDGQHAVLGFAGLNLLPLHATPATEVLRFVRRGEVFSVVRLGDLVPDVKTLRRTVSHWAWREGEGFDEQGRFVLVTIDGVRHVFDPATGRPVGSGTDLERLAAWMTGTFSSEAQSRADAEFLHVVLHMTPIWKERDDGPWLYVEQAMSSTPQAPYRQRVYRLRALGERLFESRVYELRDPAGAVGAWKDEAPPPAAGPDALIEKPGCAVILRRLDDGSFSGSTLGSQCATAFRGAAYATSEVTITAEGLRTWDRGFDAAGAQVWGSTKGPYRFERLAAAPK